MKKTNNAKFWLWQHEHGVKEIKVEADFWIQQHIQWRDEWLGEMGLIETRTLTRNKCNGLK